MAKICRGMVKKITVFCRKYWYLIAIAFTILIFISPFVIGLESFAEFFKYSPESERPGHYFPLVQVLGLITIAVITAILTAWRNLSLEKRVENDTAQTKVQDETRLDQQFLDAVKLLGDSNMDYSGREGSVYMLSALAKKSPEHTQRCVDMIGSLNRWMGERIQNRPDYFRRNANENEDDFSLWRTRVFTTDRDGLDKYAEETNQTGENQPEDSILIKQIENERLSQAILKELEKIIAEFLGRKKNSETLNLNHLYICQINLEKEQAGAGRIRYLFAKLQGADLQGADLRGANLQGADLANANLQGADLQGANLQRADLKGAQLEGADLRDLRKASLTSANLQGATFKNANLQEADLSSTNLQGAVLQGANLQGAKLFEANLEKADLQGANLQVALLLKANLEKAVLQGANLQMAFLFRANLQGADLANANLQGAVLRDTNLEGADLQNARFEGAVFFSAKLEGTNLTRAKFHGADFQCIDLKKVDLSNIEQDALKQEEADKIIKTLKEIPEIGSLRSFVGGIGTISEILVRWLEMIMKFGPCMKQGAIDRIQNAVGKPPNLRSCNFIDLHV
ncbi:pentapeptide repeat-containing protein [Candidatus Haliotispira prima]|uniref:Pentapeptide repeat-containing protein n=1 Tax=Candidatus Haliotispira prima TaxID=3034016 RepID=A0ABY8MH86_9SPIO|nr:pentapeptide repeat-containing protein [Candidatus Haliotispira prima]